MRGPSPHRAVSGLLSLQFTFCGEILSATLVVTLAVPRFSTSRTTVFTPAGFSTDGTRAQQPPDARERFRRVTHRALELVVALQKVWKIAATTECLRIHVALEPRPQAAHRHRPVAAVNDARRQRLGQSLRDGSAADAVVEHAERAVVAVEIWMTPGQLDEIGKPIRIEQRALRRAVRCDDRDADLQRKFEPARIRELGIDHRQRLFAAGVREQRQLRLRHALPEFRVSPVGAVDVLHVRQNFHHHRTAREATLQFLQRIGSRGMKRDRRQELRVFAREPEHVIVRHVEQTCALDEFALRVIDLLLRENHRRAERRLAQPGQQMLDVKPIEVATQRVGGHPDGFEEKSRLKPAKETLRLEPTTSAARTRADDVDVHVNGRQRGRIHSVAEDLTQRRQGAMVWRGQVSTKAFPCPQSWGEEEKLKPRYLLSYWPPGSGTW